MKRLRVWFGLTGLLLASSMAWAADKPGAPPVDLAQRLAEVQADPARMATFIRTGEKVAAVCANCHGDGGYSIKPDVPNLAGQNSSYLMEQVRLFAEGKRKYEFMEGMIKAMNADEKVGMVLFYSSREVPRKPVTDARLAKRGQEIFSSNCFRCHGNDGRGNAQFARIAGQQAEYLRNNLKRYRDKDPVRPNPLMRATTQMLSDDDINALAVYVSSMP